MPSFYSSRYSRRRSTGSIRNHRSRVAFGGRDSDSELALCSVRSLTATAATFGRFGVAGIKYLPSLGLVFLNYRKVSFRKRHVQYRCGFHLQHQRHRRRNPELAEFGERPISPAGLSSFWTLVTGAISGFLTCFCSYRPPDSTGQLFAIYPRLRDVRIHPYLLGPSCWLCGRVGPVGQLSRTYFVEPDIFQSGGLL